jgi:hypothetical protein
MLGRTTAASQRRGSRGVVGDKSPLYRKKTVRGRFAATDADKPQVSWPCAVKRRCASDPYGEGERYQVLKRLVESRDWAATFATLKASGLRGLGGAGYAAELGLPQLAPHDLRRSCARLCHVAGGELEQTLCSSQVTGSSDP